MDDRFYHGIIGSTARVCGYELTALTPWHHIILSAINSPVLVPDEDTDAGDLLLFLKVVTCKWPALPKLSARVKDMWWHARLRKPAILKRELGKLKEWLEAQLSNPVLWDADDKSTGKTLSSPSVFALVVGLISKGNINIETAWNMRIAEARWYDATLAELNGADIKFAYQGEEEEIRDRLQAINEADIVEAARQHMPPDKFKAWLKNRKAK